MNKKGTVLIGLIHTKLCTATIVTMAFKMAFMSVAAAAIWHIPAWSKAKAQGGDAPAIYQAQKMWPQGVFDSLPGKHSSTWIKFKKGNGGNFEGGMSN